MKRTIENLTHKRQEIEDNFLSRIKSLKEESSAVLPVNLFLEIIQHFETLLSLKEKSRRKSIFSLFPKKTGKESRENEVKQEIFRLIGETKRSLEEHSRQSAKFLNSLGQLFELQISLMDAKDKEWDALASNHVGMIFKSMEWRVDKLTAEYQDIKTLMKKFILLREKLNALLETLETKNLPSHSQVEEIIQPLEDWPYIAFENRYRGNEEEVKKQLSGYLKYFDEGKVLDLGCGRGEFLSLLAERGIEAEGVDINGEMVDICKEKGLICQKADLLEWLGSHPNNTLKGIFASQVIEHLSPEYLTKLIEQAYFKLASGGRIVLETINPTSVFALVQTFILDLSHTKPIPPQTLKFMLETKGFIRVENIFSGTLDEERLQTIPEADDKSSLLNRNFDKLNKLLFGPINYAAVGEKP